MEKIEQEFAKVNSDIDNVTNQILALESILEKEYEDWTQKEKNKYGNHEKLREKENKLREKESQLREKESQLIDILLEKEKQRTQQAEGKVLNGLLISGNIQTTHDILKMTFDAIGKAKFHSASNAKTTSVQKKYPMTSPLILKVWTSFEDEALKCSFPNVSLSKPFIPVPPRNCSGEYGVHAVGDYSLFDTIMVLIENLPDTSEYESLKKGKFVAIEGRKVLCDPDRIWVNEPHSLAKLSIEIKAPWSFKVDGDIIEAYKKESNSFFGTPPDDPPARRAKGKVMCAIEQIYVYMSINRQRYGCLSTFNETWFFMKMEDESNHDKSLLYVSPAISCSSSQPCTLVRAWLFILSVIEKDSGWLYSTPRSSEVAIPSFASGNKSFMGNKYESISLDGLVHWDSVIARSQAGAVATGRFVNMENVVFKTIDISKRKDGLDQFDHEISIYRELDSLQGHVIPTLIAYGNLGGLLQVIVLENVGKSITSEQAVQKHDEINTALQRIHEKGIVHGDLRLPNILVDENNIVRIIDFGMSVKQEGDIIESFSLDSDVHME